MRVSIVFAPKGQNYSRLVEIAKAISIVLEKRGYNTELLNTVLDSDKKLILSDYLIVLAEPVSFFSKKVSPSLSTFLMNCGVISGKRASTILVGKTLLKTKTMDSLMKIVEGEGVILKTSQFINNVSQATAFAETVNVERNY